jgi:two-component system sensor histidine kinase PilS (NtrC family)
MILVAVLQGDEPLLGATYPFLFAATAGAYTLCAILIALIIRGEHWQTRQIAWVQLIVDIISIGLLVHASGGIGSGLEALLVVFVISSSMTLSSRSSYLAAALAALAILLEQSISYLQGASDAPQFIAAGLTGAIMLVVVAALQPYTRRISETEELARQRGVDLENLAQLNDYIIQNLREAILVVDDRQHIRLVNQAAADRLAQPELRSGDHLSNASAQIYELLNKWRAGELDLAHEIPNFVSADQATVINAHFAPLGGRQSDGPVLIFLEDASLLADKVQQSKLAALGRLSASIAHEIRNPIGALSHAAQLLKESPDIGPQDQRFLDIIQTNSKRVSEIVDNILQLSRKDAVKSRQILLDKWCGDFIHEFVSTLELFEGQLSIVDSENVEKRMDPGHLHQVVWNLCENAVKYASETAGAIAVEIRFGRLTRNGRPFLEISDHGPGIPQDMQESVFEPFATGRSGGTGLGLYICRELCERNGGTLRYRPRDGGGSIFQIVFSDPERWELGTN